MSQDLFLISISTHSLLFTVSINNILNQITSSEFSNAILSMPTPDGMVARVGRTDSLLTLFDPCRPMEKKKLHYNLFTLIQISYLIATPSWPSKAWLSISVRSRVGTIPRVDLNETAAST
jgi:hypothetical protein